jgi:hypothetical protein
MMRMFSRSISTTALATLAFGATTLPASADQTPSGAPQNIVQAEATDAHQVAQRSHVQVASFGGDNNDSTNAAIAYAHDCTGCHTVAVAFQAVLVTGQPSTAAPENDAIVVNDHCTSCVGFAFAYQDVIATNGPARLSDDANDKVHDIAEQARALARSDLSPADLNSALESLAAKFKQTVESGIVGAHQRGHDFERETVRRG